MRSTRSKKSLSACGVGIGRIDFLTLIVVYTHVEIEGEVRWLNLRKNMVAGRWYIVRNGSEFARRLARDGLNLVLVPRRKNRIDRFASELCQPFGHIVKFMQAGKSSRKTESRAEMSSPAKAA